MRPSLSMSLLSLVIADEACDHDRLDDNTLWLPESGENSNYGNLNGSVVLCLSRPVAVKDLKLHVKGVHYVKCVQ